MSALELHMEKPRVNPIQKKDFKKNKTYFLKDKFFPW